MAELARWQWNDIGTWRDFAEQYQAEMEAAFQCRSRSLELTIPPFGRFRMDLIDMMQVTLTGVNASYARAIRRQARRIEVGYFILGCDGDIFASDSAIDQIEDEPVMEALTSLLLRIVNEPEDFEARSVQLNEEPHLSTLGQCEAAVQFLSERGFELIQEGNSRFLVFMMDEVGGLAEAAGEVKASHERLRKQQARGNGSRGAAPISDPLPPAAAQQSEVGPGRDQEDNSSDATSSVVRESSKGNRHGGKGRKGKGKGLGRGGKGSLVWRPKRPQMLPPSALVSRDSVAARYVEDTPLARTSDGVDLADFGDFQVQLVLPDGRERAVVLKEETLTELLEAAKEVSNLRLPGLQTTPKRKPLGLASEPGLMLREAADLQRGDRVVIQDFEAEFIERLQNGLIRLRDLAFLAPLLDWDKPELLKLVHGRLRSLLEGSANAWCQAAGCHVEEELGYGRALLRRLHADKPLEVRLEVCRQLLPVEKKDIKTVLPVNREKFMATALTGLQRISQQDLRKHFTVHFEDEVAEDHGGPRRDFFGSFGANLLKMPDLWKRLDKGALVPVADVIAERSPKQKDVPSMYQACGRACGLAAKMGDVIGEELAGFFLHQVARDDVVGLEELQQQLSQTDADDIRASKTLLQQNLSETGMRGQRMTRTITYTDVEVELVPGGKEVEVTEDNKAEWLQLHLRHKLYSSLEKAADAFREGILDVFGGSRRTCPLFVLLSPSELSMIWAGTSVSDNAVQQWQEVAVVSEEVSRQAEWLWEVLSEGDAALRGGVLKFCTGVNRLPRAGLQSFQVQPADGNDEALPRAMTCANMLQLPRYSSKEVLQSRLVKAVELCDGFQIL